MTYQKWLSASEQARSQTVRAYNEELFKAVQEFNFEYRIQHPELGQRWLVAVGRVVRDSQGRSIRLIGVNTDITERKRSEVARAQLAAIVESSDDAIISTDLSGNDHQLESRRGKTVRL